MSKPNPAELILHPDGSIYHLKIRPENLADTVLLVGDPGRVAAISAHFDRYDFKGQNREILTHTGFIGSKRITVMSTGMGTDNIDIVLNELDALATFDFQLRTPHPSPRKLDLIRIGTTGSLHRDIPVNSFILSGVGLVMDTLLNFYKTESSAFLHSLAEAFAQQGRWDSSLGMPYAVECNRELASLFRENAVEGITATAPGFYGPQGRFLRLPLKMPDLNERMMQFEYKGLRITNLEMETSALYGLSALMGHRALTLCLAIANRASGEFNQNYKPEMDKLIRLVIEKIIR